MSLPHVLLGLLAEPASGYDLKQEFGQSIRYFWSAELSQIYPALAKLERDGLLESSREPSPKGPSRKVYRRTAEGQKALKEWLLRGPVCRTERLDYLAQMFFLETIPPARRRKFIEDLRDDFQERLHALEAVEQYWSESDPRYPDRLPDHEKYRQMTLKLGLKRYAATVEWCEECLERM